ncbi:TlpA family protein disulfide reductase [Granulicella arctica]|uniref:TlpA family protein disulfide reductase n=1 Tax=Granulicella arctica TaxID=940613 RepID=UPI0021E09C61|nr:TlpA disulfide reductase family protein [Granulicella arctica]
MPKLKLVAALLLATVCLLVQTKQTAAADKPIKFKDRAGATHTIAELRGHPAVVNFWATWCGPCKDEMPRLQKLSETYALKNVQFVAISLDAPDTRNKIDATLATAGFKIPVWLGATDRTLTDLKLGILVPATLILDENGEVVGKIEGEAKDVDIQSRLDWLLGGKQGQQPTLIQKNG